MEDIKDTSFLKKGSDTDNKNEYEKKEDEGDAVTNLTTKIFSPTQSLNIMNISGSRLDNVAWHDFSECEFVLNPEYMGNDGQPGYIKSLGLAVFKPDSINFGIKLVYRQEWRPLGNQRGEIVKTIPLGPKQVEKVSTKIVRRTKIAKTSETIKSIETTSEMMESTKDSSEIVSEAVSNFKWHVDTDASVSFGVGFVKGTAGIKAGMAGELAAKTTERNSKLSEAMQKTASKMRSETKVVVSTESESTIESATASEINNPNDEIAITYVFSKLQRQYEILTRLVEVNSVVMIALPVPEKIDYVFVKRYDWIIAKVLLDDSFRDAVNAISMEPESMDTAELDDKLVGQKISPSSTETLSKIPQLQSLSISGTNLDEDSQRYREILKEQRERVKQEYIKNDKFKRLYKHIEDNIFHYMRALWSQEDPQQRLLRLQKLGKKVPAKWSFIGKFRDTSYTGEGYSSTLDDLLYEMIEHDLAMDDKSKDEFEKYIKDELQRKEAELIKKCDEELAFNTTSHNNETSIAILSEKERLLKLRDGEKSKVEGELRHSLDVMREDFERQMNSECTAKISAEHNRIEKELKAGRENDFALLQLKRSELEQLKNDVYDRFQSVQNDFNVNRLPWVVSIGIPIEKNSSVQETVKLITSLKQMIETHCIQNRDAKNSYERNAQWLPSLDRQYNALVQCENKTNVAIKLQNEVDSLTALLNELLSSIETMKQTATGTITAEYENKKINQRSVLATRLDNEIKIAVDVLMKKYDGLTIEAEMRIRNDSEILLKQENELIKQRWNIEIPKAKTWLERKLRREKKEQVHFEGEFKPKIGDEVDLTELLNPAGPIGYYGNYAIFYLKPDVRSSEIMSLLDVIKFPYNYYTSTDLEPQLMDPLLKQYTKDYTGIIPAETEKREMVEYIPELRIKVMDNIAIDNRLYSKHYPEYLFRKELTRKFVMDTNNLILDVEAGIGSALEAYKLAHRGVDVLKAQEEKEKMRLENERRKLLIKENNMSALNWSENQKFILLDSEKIASSIKAMFPNALGISKNTTSIPVSQQNAQNPEKVCIFGNVKVFGKSKPINDASIFIFREPIELDCFFSPTQKITTTGDGQYHLALEKGNYIVAVGASDFEPQAQIANLQTPALNVSFNLKKSVAKGYVGDKQRKVLHNPDCVIVAMISNNDRIIINSLEDSRKEGLANCVFCQSK